MWPLEDAGKKGEQISRHDGSDLPRATADREERLFVRSVRRYQPSDVHTNVDPDHSQTADRAKFTLVPTVMPSVEQEDESRLKLCPDDHRRRVWRQTGLRADPSFPIAYHTGPQPEYHGLIFQQDNTKQHTTRIHMNYVTAYQTLPWPARSPNPFPIKHAWDMMGRRLHLPGNVDDNWRKFGKKYRRKPSGSL
ncbi:transposable element Tc1 transposase [Trichonephila clavipes]|uniref:Transposable element Tc1 transposase n=1 Tax=Trichonephila clavipes TaxID=2585209 RepID=A0A8X6W634_TRICX|nr:transposable element Tc1 transposase [Trichonephila clavipes]